MKFLPLVWRNLLQLLADILGGETQVTFGDLLVTNGGDHGLRIGRGRGGRRCSGGSGIGSRSCGCVLRERGRRKRQRGGQKQAPGKGPEGGTEPLRGQVCH